MSGQMKIQNIVSKPMKMMLGIQKSDDKVSPAP